MAMHSLPGHQQRGSGTTGDRIEHNHTGSRENHDTTNRVTRTTERRDHDTNTTHNQNPSLVCFSQNGRGTIMSMAVQTIQEPSVKEEKKDEAKERTREDPKGPGEHSQAKNKHKILNF